MKTVDIAERAGVEPGAGAALSVLFGAPSRRRRVVEETLDRRAFRPVFLEDLPAGGSMEGFDLVCPLTLADYRLFRAAQQEGRLSRRGVLMPEPETVERLADKRLFSEWMRALGCGDLLPDDATGRRMPCVVKPARGVHGLRTEIAWSAADVAAICQRIGGAVAIQPFVPGRFEYASHVLAVGGEIRTAWTIEYEMENGASVKGAPSTPVASRWIAPPCADAIARVIAATRYTGACCMDYKVHEGRPRLFEINPRPGATLMLRIGDYLRAYRAALPPAETAGIGGAMAAA